MDTLSNEMRNAVERPLIQAETPENVVRPEDITLVLCVRGHEKNLWVIDRLDMQGDYYFPCPPVVVVDFGSDEEHAEQIRLVCRRRGYSYKHVPDYGVFSAATARNLGFDTTKTDFVFFCDPDFVSERDLFSRLSETATALNMREVVDIILNPPAFHLNGKDTEGFLSLQSADEQSRFLRLLSFKLNYAAFDREANSFVAPYSNVFLINRKMFSMSGGYNTDFRGHGSEDFEYLLRLALHTIHLPLPPNPAADTFGPLRSEFFQARPYEGFRRLLELVSQPTESLGFKVFHLWHPKELESDWYRNNDWKRERFAEATSKYMDNRHQLLAIDYLSRGKAVACICVHPDHWGYFVPLRLAGYSLVPIFDGRPETISHVVEKLVAGEVGAVAVFNPYIRAHLQFAGLIALARELRRQVIVIERGALPSSIYYDDDVCYNAPSYGEAAFAAAQFTDDELNDARAYITDLRVGNKTLESMDDYATTAQRHVALTHITKPICFIPLQLEEDMAVTMFIRGEADYPTFVADLPHLIDANPDILFVVKAHPLSKFDVLKPRPNLILADRADNIHFLLDIASVTLCYNSGVGLLSLLHETPTITLGNAFYNLSGAGCRASSAKDGLARFMRGEVPAPREGLATRIAAWFLYRKYSEFVATDDVREFTTRKAHGYRNILVTVFRWKEHVFKLSRVKQIAPFSWESYAASHIAPTNYPQAEEHAPVGKLLSWGYRNYWNGNYREAASFFERAYNADRSRPNILRYAAEAHYRAGQRKDALSALKRAALAMPKNKRVRIRRAGGEAVKVTGRLAISSLAPRLQFATMFSHGEFGLAGATQACGNPGRRCVRIFAANGSRRGRHVAAA